MSTPIILVIRNTHLKTHTGTHIESSPQSIIPSTLNHIHTLVLIVTFSLSAITSGIAQINPLGLFVDLDGKVKFWTSEPNYNGNLDDTVIITFNDETSLYDLRNLKYDYLTILESPGSDWTVPSNLDPSSINDTTQYCSADNAINITFPESSIIFESMSSESIVIYEPLSASQREYRFSDDIRGDGLNDSNISLVKIKLNEFAERFQGKSLPEEDMNHLHSEISYPDTLIENRAVYDYVVDMLVAYEYDKGGLLQKVLGYHWSLGIEVDRFRYDSSGNLIYFSREELGANLTEYFFNYDKHGRVETFTENVYSQATEDSIDVSYSEKFKFTYGSSGTMNSKAEWVEGNWRTYYFEVK